MRREEHSCPPGCPDRRVIRTENGPVTCHAFCERYAKYHAGREAQRRAEQAENLTFTPATAKGIKESLKRKQV